VGDRAVRLAPDRRVTFSACLLCHSRTMGTARRCFISDPPDPRFGKPLIRMR
jgi:hypothetical protein